MTLTRRGSGYALNGDASELTEALNLLEHYIVADAQWAHNARKAPSMMAKAEKYKKLRESLAKMQSKVAKELTFDYFDETYTAVATNGDDGLYVRIYHEEKQVSPEYAVTYTVATDLMDYARVEAVDALIEMAVSDLKEKLERRAKTAIHA